MNYYHCLNCIDIQNIENIKDDEVLIDCKKQDLGGTAMKQQTFRVSERTRVNLEKKATLSQKSKSDVIIKQIYTYKMTTYQQFVLYHYEI